jgi:hypothetical protein
MRTGTSATADSSTPRRTRRGQNTAFMPIGVFDNDEMQLPWRGVPPRPIGKDRLLSYESHHLNDVYAKSPP